MKDCALGLTVLARIALAAPLLGPLIKEYLTNPQAAIFYIRDGALTILRDYGLMTRRRIVSLLVAIHKQNRHGDSIIPSHVQVLVGSFTTGGFSLLELGVPICIEFPAKAEDCYADYVESVNKFVADSGGIIPPYADDELKYLSIHKSHTSQASRCILTGSPHPDRAITDDHGALSLHKIRQLRPEYAAEVEQGFEWDVVPHEVDKAFNGLILLLQEAANAGQAVARSETRLTVALKIHSIALQYFRNAEAGLSEEDIWKMVATASSRSSEFSCEIADLVTFVRKQAGGIEIPVKLNRLVSFVRKFKPKIVTGAALAAVATAVLGEDGNGCQQFREDLVFAMHAASDKYTDTRGMQNVFTIPRDVQRIQDKGHSMVLLADKIKTMALEIKEREGAHGAAVSEALDLLGIRLVHHALMKPDPSRGTFVSMHDIGHAFVQQLADLTGKSVASPWEKGADNRAEQTDSAHKPHAPLFGTGSRADEFRRRGIEVGCAVVHMPSKTKYKVTAIDYDDEVKLTESSNKSASLSAPTFLKEFMRGVYKLPNKPECAAQDPFE